MNQNLDQDPFLMKARSWNLQKQFKWAKKTDLNQLNLWSRAAALWRPQRPEQETQLKRQFPS